MYMVVSQFDRFSGGQSDVQNHVSLIYLKSLKYS